MDNDGEEGEGETMEEEQHEEDEPIQPEQQDEEEQMEVEGEEYPLGKCQRRLQANLHKDDMVKTKKWMGRIDKTAIGQVITDMDVQNVANLMSMADIDICICEAR